MSEAGENLIYRDNVRRLSDAMREVRIAKADRNDVVVDLKTPTGRGWRFWPSS